MSSPILPKFLKVCGVAAVLAIPVVYIGFYLLLRFAPITRQSGNTYALAIQPGTKSSVKTSLQIQVNQSKLRFCEIFFTPALEVDSMISQGEVSFQEYQVSPLSGIGPRTDLWLFGGH